MKRKMLISIALVFIMLLNCIMPLIPVHADVSEGDIVLNTKLYKAVKSELMAQNIPFTYNDTAKSISIEPEVMAQITKMNLNNKGLYDISGLENFTALKHLELSNNNLSEDSNLGCLSVDNLRQTVQTNQELHHLTRKYMQQKVALLPKACVYPPQPHT